MIIQQCICQVARGKSCAVRSTTNARGSSRCSARRREGHSSLDWTEIPISQILRNLESVKERDGCSERFGGKEGGGGRGVTYIRYISWQQVYRLWNNDTKGERLVIVKCSVVRRQQQQVKSPRSCLPVVLSGKMLGWYVYKNRQYVVPYVCFG